MNVKISRKLENSEAIIVIDVFSFSSTVAVLAEKKPKNIFVTDIKSETPVKLKKELPNENVVITSDYNIRDYPPAPNFFYYESKFLGEPAKECTFIYQSSNGSPKTVESLKYSENVFICSFLNVKRIADYILENFSKDSKILLLACGDNGNKAVEDEACAQYLNHLLKTRVENNELFKELALDMANGKGDGDFFYNSLLEPSIEIFGFGLRKNLVGAVPRAVFYNDHVSQIINVG